MENNSSFADVLANYMTREERSAGQLAKLAGIPKTTIENWLAGTAKRPREWQISLKIAKALHLNLPEANALLKAARHPTIDELYERVREAKDVEGEELISHWVTQKVGSFVGIIPSLSKPYAIFVGRQEELQAISTWLGSTDVRVIILIGMSGIGKSSLAIEAGIRNANQFPSGVCYISAREISNFNLEVAASAILIQLTGMVPDLRQPPSIILQNYLRKYSILVILDNLNSLAPEELQKFVDYIRNTLPENGLSKVIITTQSYIREFNGWHFARHLPLTEGLNVDSAIQWIKHTTQALDVPFTEGVVRSIITKLEGHPKLLEITISKAKRWGWKRAHDEILQVEGDFETAFSQMIDSSIKDLPEDGKTVLQYSAVFPTATFLADEMKILVPLTTNTQWGLEQLVDSCLASYNSESGIYRIHHLVSDYMDRFIKLKDLTFQSAHSQLVQYYIGQFESSKNSPQKMLLENAIGLATWCSNNGLHELNIRLVLSLIPTLRVAGMYMQGINLISQSLDASQSASADVLSMLSILYFYLGEFSYKIGSFKASAVAFNNYLSHTKGQITRERAEAFHSLAILHSYPRTKRYLDLEPIPLYKTSIHLWHKLGEHSRVSYALNDLGYEMFYNGNHRIAKIWIERSLALGEKLPQTTKDDHCIWGIILRTTGHYYRDNKEFALAKSFYDRSVKELKQADNPIELGDTLFSYGRLSIDMDDIESAIKVLLEAITLYEKFGYSRYTANIWGSLGKAYTMKKAFDKAQFAYKTSMNILANLPPGEREDIEYITFYGLGRLESRRGNYQLAVAYLQKSLELREMIQHDEGIPDVLCELAVAFANLGKKTESLESLQKCLALENETKYIPKKSIFNRARLLKTEIEQILLKSVLVS